MSRRPSQKQGELRPLGSHQPGAASADIVQAGGPTAGVQHEEARSAHEDSISRRGAGVTSLEGVEQNPARIQEYSAVIEISANAESPYRTVRVTHAPGKVEQLKVHGSRRVLEVLLLTWRRDPQWPWMQASACPLEG